MVEELGRRLTHFLGEASRTRCFCHVINLVVKSIVTQFDIPMKNPKSQSAADELEDDDDNAEGSQNLEDLETLGQAMEAEEEEEQIQDEQEDNEKDNDEGWVDERVEMSGWEVRSLEDDVLPAQRMLAKVGLCLFVYPDLLPNHQPVSPSCAGPHMLSKTHPHVSSRAGAKYARSWHSRSASCHAT
jgi:hypothetical protein